MQKDNIILCGSWGSGSGLQPARKGLWLCSLTHLALGDVAEIYVLIYVNVLISEHVLFYNWYLQRLFWNCRWVDT